jgi:predicted heme/steroid binding protein
MYIFLKPELPIYVAVKGVVFDVTEGKGIAEV